LSGSGDFGGRASGFGNRQRPKAPWLLAALLASCAHAALPLNMHPDFALRRSQAAEVCLPPGEQLWLSRLRCEDGARVKIVSRSSVGTRQAASPLEEERQLEQLDPGRRLAPGEPDLHIVDAVVVECGGVDTTLFLDMYHCAQPPPDLAPDGFTIEPLELPNR